MEKEFNVWVSVEVPRKRLQFHIQGLIATKVSGTEESFNQSDQIGKILSRVAAVMLFRLKIEVR